MKLFLKIVLFVLVFNLHCAFGNGEDPADLLDLNLSATVHLALERSLDYKNSSLDLEISRIGHQISRIPYRSNLRFSTDSSWDKPENGSVDNDTTLDHQVNVSMNKKFASTGGTISLYSNLHQYDDDQYQAEVADSGTVTGRYLNTLGVSIDQPLLKGFGFWTDHLTLKKSNLELDNAQTQFILSRRQLILDVIARYYQALKQQKLVEVTEKSVEDAERHLKNTRIKLEEGLVAQMDVSQAELQLSRQQTSLIRARQAYESAMDSLKLKLNLPFNKRINLTETVTNLAESLNTDHLVREALQNRLELRTLENQVESSRLAITQAANRRLPALDIIFNAEVNNRNDSVSRTFEIDSDHDYSVSMGLSWSIGDRTDRQDWAQEKIRFRKLQNNLINQKQNVEKEVWDEIRNYNALIEALKVSEKSVAIAETASELASVSYQEGLTSNLDLLKAQDDLNNARNGFYSDLMDLALSKARLLNAIGREINPDKLVINDEN